MEEQIVGLLSSLPLEEGIVTIETLLKITQNLIAQPSEDRYKRLRVNNPSFLDKVWRHPSAKQFLLLAGWVEAGEFLVFVDASTDNDNLQRAFDILKETKEQLAAHSISTTTTAKSSDNASGDDDERQERLRKIREEARKQQEERRRIAEQIKSDRQETNQREVKASQSKQLQFGTNVTRFEDIGVDLNSQGG